jgi:hypothetical protein
MIIYLDPLSPKDSSDLPGSYPPVRGGEAGNLLLPYLVLLSGGVYPNPVLPRERVVSYTTFSPLPLD